MKKENQYVKKPCTHPAHDTGAMLLYVPPGQTKIIRCPGCGKETVVRGTEIRC